MISADDLLRLRSGELSFDVFARRTRPDFARLAAKLSLNLPPWMDQDDLTQEMLLAVPAILQVWRPGDSGVKSFVVFRACAHARKLASRAKNKSINEVGLESADPSSPQIDPDSGDGKLLSRSLATPETQHERVELAERVEHLLTELPKTDMQRVVMRSLAETQDMAVTADNLINHPDTRVMFAADPDLVRSRIRRVMTVLAERKAQLA